MNLTPHTHLHICQGISSFHAAEVLQTCLLMMNRRWPCGKNNGREIFMISVLFNPMVKSGMPDLYINDFFLMPGLLIGFGVTQIFVISVLFDPMVKSGMPANTAWQVAPRHCPHLRLLYLGRPRKPIIYAFNRFFSREVFSFHMGSPL